MLYTIRSYFFVSDKITNIAKHNLTNCTMDIALAVIGAVLMVLSIVGCIAPVLPSVPLAYIGIIVLQISGNPLPFLFRKILSTERKQYISLLEEHLFCSL